MDEQNSLLNKPIATTSVSEITCLDCQTIFIKILPKSVLNLELSIEIISAVRNTTGGKAFFTIVDITEIKSIDFKSRKYFAGHETAKVIKAQALIVNSALSRMIGNVYMNYNKPVIPIKLFSSIDTAKKWLKTLG